jgi:hypothetical protein
MLSAIRSTRNPLVSSISEIAVCGPEAVKPPQPTAR